MASFLNLILGLLDRIKPPPPGYIFIHDIFIQTFPECWPCRTGPAPDELRHSWKWSSVELRVRITVPIRSLIKLNSRIGRKHLEGRRVWQICKNGVLGVVVWLVTCHFVHVALCLLRHRNRCLNWHLGPGRFMVDNLISNPTAFPSYSIRVFENFV